MELFKPEFHVMEIRYGLAKFGKREIRQLALETAEGLPRQSGRLWSHLVHGEGVFDQPVYTPAVTFGGAVKQLSVAGGNQVQNLALHIGFAGCNEFLPDVSGHFKYVLLQPLHIFKDMVVDALQEIGDTALRQGGKDVAVVDEACPDRFRPAHLVGQCKLTDNLFHKRKLVLL